MDFRVGFVLALVCFLEGIQAQSNNTIKDDFQISSPEVTSWGAWGQYERCPPGTYAYAFQVVAESDQGFFGDDSALNGINLLCVGATVRRNTSEFLSKDPSTRGLTQISSSKGHEGNPRRLFECPDPYFINGFELRSESDQGWYADDSGANNLKIQCSNGQTLEGDGESWGTWTGMQTCPRGSLVCGIQTQVEEISSVDDTTLNNVRFGCC